jgi:endonuclease YncB( thermonuclease family)
MRMVAFAAATIVVAGSAAADCVDINADDVSQLTRITHIDEARASAIETGRPWPSVGSLTAINGIGKGRIRDILGQGVACVGRRVAPGERELLEGVATVLDADTLIVGRMRVRLIGIDAPEMGQACLRESTDWACGLNATSAVAELLGATPVDCEIYGHDRWHRALAVCYQNGVDLNAEIVRRGWALAWYPETGAVIGPSYDGAQREAEMKAAGIWQGTFADPWLWRQTVN